MKSCSPAFRGYNKVLFGLIYMISMALAGCQSEAPTDPKDMKYYNLRGFVENQIQYLKEKQPEVSKVAALNNKQETVKTGNIDWEKELELFLQADINKPAFRNSYEIIKRDSSVYEYRLKANNDLPVQYLQIKTDSALNQPIYVKAILRSENRIYESQREIELWCSLKDNLPQLTTYEIKGYQRLILTDPKNFNISAKIGL